MFFQSYSFAPTCSSATSSEEVEIPNPVPVEVEQASEKDIPKDADKDEIVEKAAKSGTSEEIPSAKNEIVELIDSTSQKPVLIQADLVEQLRDKVTVTKGKSTLITGGIQSKNEDVPLVENSNLKINTDDIDVVANVRTASNNGIAFGNANSQ